MYPTPHRLHPRGGLLPLAMMMTALGGIFMVGWVSLCSMRASYSANAQIAAQRRISLLNSRAFGRELALERTFLASNTLAALNTASLPSGIPTDLTTWGILDTDLGWVGLQSYSLPSTPISSSSQVVHASTGHFLNNFPFNNNGLHPGDSFVSIQRLARPNSGGPAVASLLSAPVGSDFYDGGIDAYHHYLMIKTICPCLAGDAFVIYRKPTSISTEVQFGKSSPSSPSGSRDAYTMKVSGTGRLVIRDPASFFDSSTVDRGGFRYIGVASNYLYLQKHDPNNRIIGNEVASGTSGAPTDLKPLKLPATVSTTGPFAVTDPPFNTNHLYRGELNVVNNSSHTNNSLRHIQDREAAASRAQTVDISATLLGYNIDTNVSGVHTITSTASYSSGSNTDAYWLVESLDHTTAPVKPVNASTGSSKYRTLFIRTGHVGLPHIRIQNGAVHQIVLLGQASNAEYVNAGTYGARILLLLPATGTPTTITHDIEFIGESNRRLILGIKDTLQTNIDTRWSKPDPTVTANFALPSFSHTTVTGDPDATSTTLDWHLIFINEGRHITIWSKANTVGSQSRVAIAGGFMTNWSIERPKEADDSYAATNPINIFPDWAPTYDLATLAPRDGWLENYFMLDQ